MRMRSRTNMTVTTNGMAAHVDSGDPAVDFFFNAGASRGKDIRPLFAKAFAAEPVIATKLLIWLRDARSGAGERQLFRDLLVWLESQSATNEPARRCLDAILPMVEFYGRWDDLLCFATPEWKNKSFELIAEALKNATFAEDALARLDTMSDDDVADLLTRLTQ